MKVVTAISLASFLNRASGADVSMVGSRLGRPAAASRELSIPYSFTPCDDPCVESFSEGEGFHPGAEGCPDLTLTCTGADPDYADWGGQSFGRAPTCRDGYFVMTFSRPVTSVTLHFGNDDPCCAPEGTVARLSNENAGETSEMLLNRNDLMDQFIVLNYETTFNTATFQFRVDPIDGKPSEIIDNLKFCVSPTESPTSSPTSLDDFLVAELNKASDALTENLFQSKGKYRKAIVDFESAVNAVEAKDYLNCVREVTYILEEIDCGSSSLCETVTSLGIQCFGRFSGS